MVAKFVHGLQASYVVLCTALLLFFSGEPRQPSAALRMPNSLPALRLYSFLALRTFFHSATQYDRFHLIILPTITKVYTDILSDIEYLPKGFALQRYMLRHGLNPQPSGDGCKVCTVLVL